MALGVSGFSLKHPKVRASLTARARSAKNLVSWGWDESMPVNEKWRHLCGLAVTLCGSQAAFRKEAAILKRLVKRHGAEDVETMLKGAQVLGWRTLTSLGSKDGLGRRWATEAYWRAQNERKKWTPPERLKAILREVSQ
jgi:hypothetical protein